MVVFQQLIGRIPIVFKRGIGRGEYQQPVTTWQYRNTFQVDATEREEATEGETERNGYAVGGLLLTYQSSPLSV